MNKNGKRAAAALCLAAAILFSAGCAAGPGAGRAQQLAQPQGARQEALYYGPWTVPEQEAVRFEAGAAETPCWHIPAGGSAGIELDVPEDGSYALLLRYKAGQDITLRSLLQAEIDGQSCTTQLFSIWRDESKEYGQDRTGAQTLPTQITEDSPVDDYIVDQASVSIRPFLYELSAGKHTLMLTSQDVELAVYRVSLVAESTAPAYAEYRRQYAQAELGADEIVIEAENYSVKSDSSIRVDAQRNPALFPYDYRYRLLNTLSGDSFGTAGQKVQWAFTVETPGLYSITLHYRQNTKEDIPVYQNIRIDGKTLFREMNSVPFAYTGIDYANATLSAGDAPAEIYLEAGRHTLTLEADGTPVAGAGARLSAIMARLSEIGLDIKKLSGTQADANRTWDVESYLPGVLDELADSERELMEIYAFLGTLQKENPAAALGIKQAANNLSQILDEPGKAPGKLSLLSEGSGSAVQLLVDVIYDLELQSMDLDAIYIQNGASQRDAAAGLRVKTADSFKRFFYTLLSDEEDAQEAETLQVWVNRPLHYISILQSMADTSFTPRTGIPVQISVMPSEQRIILSNATDMAPDVVMGLATNTPFDLGLRGALTDLASFPDFAEALEAYNPQAMTPYILDGHVYGITETQDFYVLLYRTDIFEKLNIEPPETWEDVRDLMPVLQRNSMNFYLQLSGYSGTKPLYSTAPFLMQAGGGIYKEGDATRTGVNSAASLKGFETLTDLYRLYSVQPVVSSFYSSFRYGQIPAGICSFSDYIRVKNAAPEIAGKWAIAPAPGFRDEDGSIRNGTTGSSSACAILSASEKQEQSWEFLKWWLSADVQAEFGNTLQTIYGSVYLWNSANMDAFARLNFPEADKAVIMEQWSQLQEINRHPALYAVERALSNAWQDVVENNVPARIALDDAALDIDREFERKLKEFGYIGENGERLREFGYMPIEQILEGDRE
ncbi:MAG: extracellular solute-binding protein [Subdoligranulum sp.]|nr:extracellular solute-binding protein [Subdoligranulum sp.]